MVISSPETGTPAACNQKGSQSDNIFSRDLHKTKHLHLRETVIYGSKHKYSEGSLKICPFSKIPIDLSLGAVTS